MAQCKYCGTEITWTKEKNKFIPINQDGEVHECQEFKKARSSVKKLNKSDISAEEIARYEKEMNKKK